MPYTGELIIDTVHCKMDHSCIENQPLFATVDQMIAMNSSVPKTSAPLASMKGNLSSKTNSLDVLKEVSKALDELKIPTRSIQSSRDNGYTGQIIHNSEYLYTGWNPSQAGDTYHDTFPRATGFTTSSSTLSLGFVPITIGGGVSGSEVAVLDTQSAADDGGFTIGVSAVTGDLTVAVGYADGDTTTGVGSNTNKQVDADVLKAGIKYVSGDITMNLGVVSGTATDNIFGGTDTKTDSHDEVNASVSYAVASGVSAVLGYTTVDQNDEAANTTNGGSAWYVGATMSF